MRDFEQPEKSPGDNASELKVLFNTFEDCRAGGTRELSDEFIDELLESDGRISVKSRLDLVEPTADDVEVVSDPQRFVELYKQTAGMVRRNLGLVVRQESLPELREKISQIEESLGGWDQKVEAAASDVLSVCAGDSKSYSRQTTLTLGFNSLLATDGLGVVGGNDELEAAGLRPTIKVQDQVFDCFLMGYSRQRLKDKLDSQEQPEPTLDRRIYLNPEMEAAPLVFEQLLQKANQAEIALQLKIYPRTVETIRRFRDTKDGKSVEGLRGDGIVVYVNNEDADRVLGLALEVAQDNADSFVGRKTSAIPQEVADGIAIGDEPTQAPGYSLTSHRAMLLDTVAGWVRDSEHEGDEARRYFRYCLGSASKQCGVDPNNLAFNA